RDAREAAYVWDDETVSNIVPEVQKRLFVCHGRPEVMTGVLRRLDTGYQHSRFVGYHNRGGTLDVFGMLYANKITWAHIIFYVAELLAEDAQLWLSAEEYLAVQGKGELECLR
ncbi:MAG TPA: xylulose 5-phosphate 3-epimerase, partial [Agitococcus sp.]|nr:xylulose 5-phosphate 3-epimerase [Agitococcus sp.]